MRVGGLRARRRDAGVQCSSGYGLLQSGSHARRDCLAHAQELCVLTNTNKTQTRCGLWVVFGALLTT